MLIVTAVYWVSEAVPLGAAALVPAFLYPFFGVLRSSEVRPLADQPPAQVNARPVRQGLREGRGTKHSGEGCFILRNNALALGLCTGCSRPCVPLPPPLTSSPSVAPCSGLGGNTTLGGEKEVSHCYCWGWRWAVLGEPEDTFYYLG